MMPFGQLEETRRTYHNVWACPHSSRLRSKLITLSGSEAHNFCRALYPKSPPQKGGALLAQTAKRSTLWGAPCFFAPRLFATFAVCRYGFVPKKPRSLSQIVAAECVEQNKNATPKGVAFFANGSILCCGAYNKKRMLTIFSVKASAFLFRLME
jgi:hypothetical protein